MKYAGFWIRALAYLIDFIPISIVVIIIFYSYLNFGQTWIMYFVDHQNVEARVQFMSERNLIRETSFGVWLIYCALMEGSILQGTLGKRVLGIKVVDRDGNRISFVCSIVRNLSKVISYLPFLLGFFWAGVSRQKHGWHDKLAKTDVVHCVPEVDSFTN